MKITLGAFPARPERCAWSSTPGTAVSSSYSTCRSSATRRTATRGVAIYAREVARRRGCSTVLAAHRRTHAALRTRREPRRNALLLGGRGARPAAPSPSSPARARSSPAVERSASCATRPVDRSASIGSRARTSRPRAKIMAAYPPPPRREGRLMLPPKASRITAPERRVVLGLDRAWLRTGWAIVELGRRHAARGRGRMHRDELRRRARRLRLRAGRRSHRRASARSSRSSSTRAPWAASPSRSRRWRLAVRARSRCSARSRSRSRSVCVATRAQSRPARAAEVKLVMTGDRDAEKHVVAGRSKGHRLDLEREVEGRARGGETDAVAVALVGARKVVR